MANVNAHTGAVIDASTETNTVTLTGSRRGSLVNKGAATVYLQWSAATVSADAGAGTGKCYLEAGDAVRIPPGVRSFAHATASGTAKLIFVEE